jgi:hypothetical protein
VIITLVSLFISYAILWSKSQWNKEYQHAFLYISEPKEKKNDEKSVNIVVIRPKEKQVYVVPLPSDLYVQTVRGYGLYKSSSLEGLRQLEKLPDSFLFQTIQSQFGINVKNVVRGQSQLLEQPLPIFKKTAWRTLFFSTQTSFSYLDRWYLWRFFSGLRDDQLSTIHLEQKNMVFVPSEGVEEGKLIVRPTDLDPFVFDMLSDPEIRNERVSVAVVNTTKVPLIGSKIARSLVNMGVNVKNVSSNSESRTKTQILMNSQELRRTKTYIVVLNFLGHDCEVKVQDSATTDYRSDIVIFIGEDIAKKL